MTNIKERPISPHLTIYRPQISSMLSIMHRATGVFLFAGLVIFCWWIIAMIYGTDELKSCVSNMTSHILSQILIFSWSFSLFYHLLNGVRHLFWDMGKGMSIESMTKSGWIVVFGSLVLTISSWSALLEF